MALSEERRLEIKYLHEQGASIEEIAKSLKMMESTVRNCAHNMTDEWKREFAKEWDETREAFYR